MHDKSQLPPIMFQYLEIKKQHPDALLLFRIGDFYECWFSDAETASKLVGLTLTIRGKGSPNPIPMAGFPHRQLESYLRKLIQCGHRVAICEDPEANRINIATAKSENSENQVN